MHTVQQGQEIEALMREVLGENYAQLMVHRVVIEEDLEKKFTSLTCEVTEAATGENSIIAGKGVGVVDAFFRGMADRFADEYPSLKTIKFSSFLVGAKMETKSDYAGTDSQAEVTVEILNSEGKNFVFSNASRSVIGSSIVTTLRALEYFINSERAFVTMYHAREDAKKRNRGDLVQRYTDHMATLVQNTSYSEVIAKIRSDANM